MDDQFRLVFTDANITPSAETYLAPEARVYATLGQAVKAGHEEDPSYGLPFVAHRFVVFEPMMVHLLYEQFVTASKA